MTELTFAEVSRINGQRCDRWHLGFLNAEQTLGDWSLADWSNALAGEVGEACNVVKKIRRVEIGAPGMLDAPIDELRAQLADELADVYLYLDLLAVVAKVDLPEAIVSKFNRVSERQGFPERLGEAVASLQDQVE